MPTKEGNGGNGPENYDPSNGQYVKADSANNDETSSVDSASAHKQKIVDGITSGKFGSRIQRTYDKADDSKKEDLINAISFLIDEKIKEKEKAEKEIDNRIVTEYVSADNIDTQGLTLEERKTALLNDTRLNKSAILNASEEELNQLLNAFYLFNSKQKQIGDDPQLVQMLQHPDGNLDGVWRSPVTLEDYQALEQNGAIDRKIYYFTNDYTGADKQQKLDAINAYRLLGSQYVALKASKNLDTTADEAIMTKFSNSNSPYSWKRKHKDSVYNEETTSSRALMTTSKQYGVETNRNIKRIYDSGNEDGIRLLAEYVKSYTWVADPLRGNHFSSGGASPLGRKNAQNWKNNVDKITQALDVCSYKDDMWLVRGSNYIGDNKNGIDINQYLGHLQDLVGMCFKDQGFVSTSASKVNYTGGARGVNAQFATTRIIQHIYAPSTTKMLHMASFAAGDSTDGNDYTEQNEFLIQRGYTYRITKAYAKNNQIHIDCEVVLGSDEGKYDDNELLNIERTFVS